MTAAANVQQSSPIWTVADGLELRKMKRESEWGVDFKKNYETVAKTIAENIANKIFSNLKETLDDAFKPIPDSNNLLSFEYSFNVQNSDHIHMIATLSGSAGELAPFKEWFARIGTDNTNIDVGYFQQEMNTLAKVTQLELKTKLDNILKVQGNSPLKGQMFKARQDTINVELWVDETLQNVDDQSTNEQASSSSISNWFNKIVEELS